MTKDIATELAEKMANSVVPQIASLIEIKHYLDGVIDHNYGVDGKKIKELQKIVLLLDAKIVDGILSDEFKSFVDFDRADEVVREVAMNSSVRGSFYKS